MDAIKKFSEKKIIKSISAFFESPLFLLLFGTAVLLFYVLNIPVVTLVIFAVCGCFICLFAEDTRATMGLLVLLMFSFRNKDNVACYRTTFAICTYVVGGIPLLASAIYRLAFRSEPLKDGWGLLGVGLLSASILLGGTFTQYYSQKNFMNALIMSSTLFGGYVFYAFTLQKREGTLLYLARTCAIAVCIIALEVLELYKRKYTWGTPLDWIWKGKILLGWTRSNMVGEMMVFFLPAVFYLIYKERFGILYYLVVLVGLFGIFLTLSRNAILWSIITVIIGTTANCLVGRRKLANLIIGILSILGICVSFVVVSKLGYLDNVLQFFLESGLDDHGRFEVWTTHWNLFVDSPLHGVGYKTYKVMSGDIVDKAHNTLVQMLASSGLIGLSCYLVHRVQTVYSVAKKPTTERLWIGGTVLVGLLMSLLSPLFFQVYFRVCYVVLLVALEKS